jgi:hypothetical protein
MKVNPSVLTRHLLCSNDIEYQEQLAGQVAEKLTWRIDRPLKAKQDRRIIVQHLDVISKVKREAYYRDFLSFIDLREFNSTYNEKTKACKTFI